MHGSTPDNQQGNLPKFLVSGSSGFDSSRHLCSMQTRRDFRILSVPFRDDYDFEHDSSRLMNNISQMKR